MARSKPLVELNSAQEVDAQQIYERLREVFDEELRSMARFMASKPNGQLFGQTEFDLRDRVHELGARVLETAVDERQKKGRVRGS